MHGRVGIDASTCGHVKMRPCWYRCVEVWPRQCTNVPGPMRQGAAASMHRRVDTDSRSDASRYERVGTDAPRSGRIEVRPHRGRPRRCMDTSVSMHRGATTSRCGRAGTHALRCNRVNSRTPRDRRVKVRAHRCTDVSVPMCRGTIRPRRGPTRQGTNASVPMNRGAAASRSTTSTHGRDGINASRCGQVEMRPRQGSDAPVSTR